MECFGNATWRSVWLEFCEFGVTTEDLDPLRLNIIYLSILPINKTPLLSLPLMVLSYKFLEIHIGMLEYIEVFKISSCVYRYGDRIQGMPRTELCGNRC